MYSVLIGLLGDLTLLQKFIRVYICESKYDSIPYMIVTVGVIFIYCYILLSVNMRILNILRLNSHER